ncbi:ATP-dependent DNA helicase DinG [Methylophaga sp.]|uniref:ATP-dependent DNA helicase DinG n=1 Tax=Methylophaga sp. TaxID=2024840 RepID=UPI0013FF8130|nr:ATP-dependent DNA helicase DinG [Methylophaga sp.]MTI63973.1 ATP-dependent DNA helicase DinG [Methylophaga sp.]
MSEAIFRRLQAAIPDFKPRPQQAQMSQFIADQMTKPAQQRIAVVEAPTGVGKTLAYLSGAIEAAISNKKTLVISTATVNLQQQLIQKDLPQFSAALEQPIRFVQVKGRRRYLCPSKLSQLATAPAQQTLDIDIDAKYQQALHVAAAKQMLSEWERERWDGDRDSRSDKISSDLWNQVSTDSEGCAGKSCSFYLRCPYYKLRREMVSAQVVVANHDLILSDADLGGGLVLPNPEEVLFVFDEAHNLPRKALDHAAKALNFIQLYQTTETADSVLKKIPSALAFRQHDFGYMLSELRRDLPAVISHLQQMETILQSDGLVHDLLAQRISEPRIFWNSPLVNALLIPCQNLLQRANNIYKHYSVLAKWIKEGLEKTQLSNKVGEALLPQVGTVQNIFGYLIDFMALFLEPDQADRPPNVRWLSVEQFAKQQTLVIHAGPMTAAYFLDRSLWTRAFGVVLTSATLRGMGLFHRFRMDCGLHRFDEQHFLAVPSPFKYNDQATLNLPAMRYLPNEQQLQWRQEVVTRLKEVIDTSEATLVLFTSREVMEAVYRQLPQEISRLVLIQGDTLSPKNMVQRHILQVEAGQGSIIFGMDRFAEGVDLPGDLCTHVIITKLPFPVFTRPIEQAKQEWIIRRGGQPFTALSLPAVSVKLIQACGRLLRKETDSGRITILDRRLLTKGYGKQLLEHLPDYRLVL